VLVPTKTRGEGYNWVRWGLLIGHDENILSKAIFYIRLHDDEWEGVIGLGGIGRHGNGLFMFKDNKRGT
jgi:hypothetical protein